MSNCPFNWTIKLSWHAYWLIVPFGDERQQIYGCPFCSLYLFCQQQFKTIMVHCPLKYFFQNPFGAFFFSEWCGWAVGLAVRKRLLLKMAPGVGLLPSVRQQLRRPRKIDCWRNFAENLLQSPSLAALNLSWLSRLVFHDMCVITCENVINVE